MRWLGGAIGFVVGSLVGWGAGLIWNPASYEQVLPIMLATTVAGTIMGALVAKRPDIPI